MADLTGLVTSIPGLVVACVDVYRLIHAARRLDKEGSIIVTQVAIEQAKFAFWLQEVGLTEGPGLKPSLRLHPPLPRLLVDVLTSIKQILDKYELVKHDESVNATAARLALPERFWRFKSKTAESESSFVPRRTSISKLLGYAVIDRARAKELVADLASFNTNLDFFTRCSQGHDPLRLPSRLLPYVLEKADLEKLIEASANYDPDMRACAEFKKQVMTISRNASRGPSKRSSLCWSSPWIINRRPLKSGSQRALAESCRPQDRDGDSGNSSSSTPQHVLLEDKSFAEFSSVSNYEAFVEQRVQEIAHVLAKSPKPERLRVLECLGYVTNRGKHSFSFVFAMPPGAAVNCPPATLEDLICGRESVRRPAPSLSKRISIAHSLAAALALLQACGVLHKAFHAGNVLFFRPSEDEPYDLGRPYISGFDYARLHGKAFESEKVASSFAEKQTFSHPEYSFASTQRYAKVFDIYSLGLVLLQVGLWKSFSSIVEDLPNPDARVLRQIRKAVMCDCSKLDSGGRAVVEELQAKVRAAPVFGHGTEETTPFDRAKIRESLVENLSMISSDIGDIYTAVVARCLTGDIGASEIPSATVSSSSDEDTSDDILQDSFVENIVEELRRCII